MLLLLLAACANGLFAPCDFTADCDHMPEEVDGVCVEASSDGLCTAACVSDADCAVLGSGLVCASFESEDDTYCFPECGDQDVCPQGLTCRNTGGGQEHEKVCFLS